MGEEKKGDEARKRSRRTWQGLFGDIGTGVARTALGGVQTGTNLGRQIAEAVDDLVGDLGGQERQRDRRSRDEDGPEDTEPKSDAKE